MKEDIFSWSLYVYPEALLGHFIIFTQLFFFLGVTILKSENENQILPN